MCIVSKSVLIRFGAVSFLILGLVSLGGFKTEDQVQAREKSDQTRKVDACFYDRDVDGFETSSSGEKITISTYRGEKYELTLGAGCMNADSAMAISVRGRSGFSRICGALDGTVRYNSLGVVESCPILEVRHIPKPPKAETKPRSVDKQP